MVVLYKKVFNAKKSESAYLVYAKRKKLCPLLALPSFFMIVLQHLMYNLIYFERNLMFSKKELLNLIVLIGFYNFWGHVRLHKCSFYAVYKVSIENSSARADNFLSYK